MKVADLIDQPNMRWNEHLLSELCDELCMEDVKKLDMLRCHLEDKLFWIRNKTYRFTVKSCYQLCSGRGNETEGENVWRSIWNAHLHKRLKIFLWRVASNIMPTNLLLHN